MTLAVYVAASSREPERVCAAQALLREIGCELTLDWLTPIEANLARGVRDADISLADQQRHAREDFDAIDRADLVWLLAPTQATKGAYVEIGFAFGRGKPVLVTGATSCIFEMLATYHYLLDSEARGLLATMVLERALHVRDVCVDCRIPLAVTTTRDPFGEMRCCACAREALRMVPG